MLAGGQDVAQKQKLVLQLLRNVGQKNMYPELVALGKTWNPEQMIDRYANQWAVKNFVSMWKQGMLPRGEVFHVYNDSQLKEVVALFDTLYFAKDFDTFIKTAAWARDHVNEGQFVYALSVAAVHHDDCEGVMLPPLYEVYPHLYFHASDMSDFYSAKMQNVYNYVKMTNWTGGYEIPMMIVGGVMLVSAILMVVLARQNKAAVTAAGLAAAQEKADAAGLRAPRS